MSFVAYLGKVELSLFNQETNNKLSTPIQLYYQKLFNNNFPRSHISKTFLQALISSLPCINVILVSCANWLVVQLIFKMLSSFELFKIYLCTF